MKKIIISITLSIFILAFANSCKDTGTKPNGNTTPKDTFLVETDTMTFDMNKDWCCFNSSKFTYLKENNFFINSDSSYLRFFNLPIKDKCVWILSDTLITDTLKYLSIDFKNYSLLGQYTLVVMIENINKDFWSIPWYKYHNITVKRNDIKKEIQYHVEFAYPSKNFDFKKVFYIDDEYSYGNWIKVRKFPNDYKVTFHVDTLFKDSL